MTSLEDREHHRNSDDPKSRALTALWAPYYRDEMEKVAIEKAIDAPLDAETIQQLNEYNADFHRERDRLRGQMKRLRKRMRIYGLIN